MKRRRMASVSAVPRRSAVAYFTISSYCWRINSQSIGGADCPITLAVVRPTFCKVIPTTVAPAKTVRAATTVTKATDLAPLVRPENAPNQANGNDGGPKDRAGY